MSLWFEANCFQMKIGGVGKLFSSISPSPSCIFVFLHVLGASRPPTRPHPPTPSLRPCKRNAADSLVPSSPSPLTIPAFSGFCPSRFLLRHAMKDTRPLETLSLRKEVSWSPPSLLLFFHNLLFMSDRPPPDKWLPYGGREREREGRKNSLCIPDLLMAFSESPSSFTNLI